MNTRRLLSFTVPGVPVAQPRQRTTTIAGRPHNYTPKKHPVAAYKTQIKLYAHKAICGGMRAPWRWPVEDAIHLEVQFFFPRPQSKPWKRKSMIREYKTTIPDLDNCLKAVQDALNGVVWKDDAQVCEVYMRKFIVSGEGKPRTEIAISNLEQPTGEGS